MSLFLSLQVKSSHQVLLLMVKHFTECLIFESKESLHLMEARAYLYR